MGRTAATTPHAKAARVVVEEHGARRTTPVRRRLEGMTARAVQEERSSRDQLLEMLHATTYLLMRQNHADARQALAPLGLQPPMAFVLLMISQEEIHHPKGLADLLCVPPSMMSVMLNDLEKRDLLVRSTDPEDRRRVLLSITGTGQDMIGKIMDAWTTVTRDRLARLTEDDLETLVRLQRLLLEIAP